MTSPKSQTHSGYFRGPKANRETVIRVVYLRARIYQIVVGRIQPMQAASFFSFAFYFVHKQGYCQAISRSYPRKVFACHEVKFLKSTSCSRAMAFVYLALCFECHVFLAQVARFPVVFVGCKTEAYIPNYNTRAPTCGHLRTFAA